MTRATISILLTLSLLANQGLSYVHTHCGSEDAAPCHSPHGGRPHIHLRGHAHHQHAGHHAEHGHDADHHHLNHASPEGCSEDAAAELLRGLRCTSLARPSSDHEGDAVYLAETVVFVRGHKSDSSGFSPHHEFQWLPPERHDERRFEHLHDHWRMAFVGNHCPLYLRLLFLRI